MECPLCPVYLAAYVILRVPLVVPDDQQSPQHICVDNVSYEEWHDVGELTLSHLILGNTAPTRCEILAALLYPSYLIVRTLALERRVNVSQPGTVLRLTISVLCALSVHVSC